MFWNHFEIPDNYNYYFVRENVTVLRILFLGFGVVAPLGLLGLCLARRSPSAWLFFLFIVGYMISIVPFHMASRYRLPVVPVLILFAGHAAALAVGALRERRFTKVSLGLVAAVILAVVVNWKVVEEGGTFKTPYMDLGIIAAEEGDFAEAMRYYEKALEIDPHFAPALYNMGNALASQGEFRRAADAYQRALASDPEFLMAYENLGISFIRMGRFEDALSVFDTALAQRPDYVPAMVGKGIAYHSAGRYTEAIEAYGEAIEIQPEAARAHYNQACAYARNGQVRAARQALDRAIQLNPEYEQKAKGDPDLENVR
jgi:tetratricopeptide (TPR) repeat protein